MRIIIVYSVFFVFFSASFSRVSGTGMREGTDTLGHPGMFYVVAIIRIDEYFILRFFKF